jgi:hypothetical protein
MRKMSKITSKEIRGIVEEYHRSLPEWHHVSDETLVRTDGPVLQAIGFESLSGGEYRPVNYVQVLAAPAPGGRGRVDFFAQTPKGRPRTASLRSHQAVREQMVEAMKREFTPAIMEPLNAPVVLDLCEQNAIPRSGEAYALAALNAYLGRRERALFWCFRYNDLVNQLGRPWQQWHHQQRAFLDSLEQWLKAGQVKQELDRVLQEERRKWGLA